MNNMPKQKGVLYLDKHTLKVFISGKGEILILEIPPQIISDMEIYDTSALELLLSSFMKQYTIPPTQYILVLSNGIVFDNPVQTTSSVDRADEVKAFLDTVPFEEIASKIYTVGATSVIVATNNQLINSIKKSLKKLDSPVLSVLPVSALDKQYTAKNDLDKDIGQYILKKFDDMKTLDMSDQDEPASGGYFHYDNTPTKQSKATLPVLLAVFAVLIGILGFLLWMQQTPQKPINATVTPTAYIPPSVTPTIVAPTLTATESATLNLSQYRVEVVNGVGPISAGEAARTALTKMGFKNIFITNVAALSSKSLIVFSQKVPADVRQLILSELREKLGNFSTQETTDSQFDIVITLGKP